MLLRFPPRVKFTFYNCIIVQIKIRMRNCSAIGRRSLKRSKRVYFYLMLKSITHTPYLALNVWVSAEFFLSLYLINHAAGLTAKTPTLFWISLAAWMSLDQHPLLLCYFYLDLKKRCEWWCSMQNFPFSFHGVSMELCLFPGVSLCPEFAFLNCFGMHLMRIYKITC